MIPVDVYPHQEVPGCFDVLRVPEQCLFASDFTFFSFPVLSGLMLYRPAIVVVNYDHFQVVLCGDCHAMLSKGRMPRFALANGLYRGVLPTDFQYLTWVEEMVCNTCAHDICVVSTATVLPRTPTLVPILLNNNSTQNLPKQSILVFYT